MTTNKPEIVAWRWRKPVVNDQGETVGATAWELSDAPGFLPWWTNDPLVRLSDYQRLQAECDQLRQDAERYRFIRAKVYASNAYGRASWKFHYDNLPLPLDNPTRGSVEQHFEDAIDHARRAEENK